LINNAGIWAAGPVETYDVKKINQLFATNTLGTIYMTQAVIPYMKKQNRGQILNVMSIAGVECKDAYGIIYTATKHALSGFTDTLKEELSGTGIKVMGFYPGGMATNILKAAGIEMPNSEDLSMKTEDVAKIISFVLSLPKDVVMDHFEVRKFTSKV
jgi:short-subunit dehydrogenase